MKVHGKSKDTRKWNCNEKLNPKYHYKRMFIITFHVFHYICKIEKKQTQHIKKNKRKKTKQNNNDILCYICVYQLFCRL